MNSNTSGATVAALTFKPRTEGDKLTDDILQELQRRAEISVELQRASDIVGTAQPPTDKTKIWWPIDPTTGARIGKPKVWDATTEQWVPFGSSGVVEVPQRKRRNGIVQFANAGSVFNVDFLDIQTTNYMVTLTPFAFVDGASVSPPANMDNFAYVITSRSNAQFTVQVFAGPAGGFSFLWEVAEMAGQTDDETA